MDTFVLVLGAIVVVALIFVFFVNDPFNIFPKK